MSEAIILIVSPKNGYSHLVADTLENLHFFANSVGYKRCWFHNKRGKKRPHYDINEVDFDRVVEAGAIHVHSYEIINLLKKYYS